MQDYLRDQPDNIKSFNIVAETTAFFNMVYSNINSKTIDLVNILFSTLNEFCSGNQSNRYVILNCKVVDFVNFILRAGEYDDCPFEKVTSSTAANLRTGFFVNPSRGVVTHARTIRAHNPPPHTHTHKYTHAGARTHNTRTPDAHPRACTHTHPHTHTHTHTHTSTRAHTFVSMHKYAHAHTHTHTHIQARVHTHL